MFSNFQNVSFRWQDRCLQIRLAAQELLVAELKNLGPKGRKHLVDVWGAYLPKYGDPPFHTTNGGGAGGSTSQLNVIEDELDEEEDDMDEDEANSTAMEMRRNQVRQFALSGLHPDGLPVVSFA